MLTHIHTLVIIVIVKTKESEWVFRHVYCVDFNEFSFLLNFMTLEFEWMFSHSSLNFFMCIKVILSFYHIHSQLSHWNMYIHTHTHISVWFSEQVKLEEWLSNVFGVSVCVYDPSIDLTQSRYIDLIFHSVLIVRSLSIAIFQQYVW